MGYALLEKCYSFYMVKPSNTPTPFSNALSHLVGSEAATPQAASAKYNKQASNQSNDTFSKKNINPKMEAPGLTLPHSAKNAKDHAIERLQKALIEANASPDKLKPSKQIDALRTFVIEAHAKANKLDKTDKTRADALRNIAQEAANQLQPLLIANEQKWIKFAQNKIDKANTPNSQVGRTSKDPDFKTNYINTAKAEQEKHTKNINQYKASTYKDWPEFKNKLGS